MPFIACLTTFSELMDSLVDWPKKR